MRRRPDPDDPDLPLAELFAEWPEAALLFMARRMLCPGCLIAPFHTIIDACEEYEFDEDAFRRELRDWIEHGDDARARAAPVAARV